MKTKIFYGWWIVITMIPAMVVHSGAVFYVFGVFYKPLIEAFGWTRSEVAVAISVYLLTLGFSAPLIGRLTDQYGAKIVIWLGALLGGSAFILLSWISSLWQFYALYFVLGIAFSACGLVPVNSAISKWFLKKRGMVTGIVMSGVSLGALIVTPIGGYLVNNYSWRTTYVFLGFFSWILVIPIFLFVMRNSPQELGLQPDGNTTAPEQSDKLSQDKTANTTGASQIAWTMKTVIKTLPFWMICLAYFVAFLVIGAILTHQIAFLTDSGMSPTAAAFVLGITGFMGGVGKIAFGYVADKISPNKISALALVLQAFGVIILIFAQSMTLIWAYVIVFGFAMGGQLALQPLIVSRFFGLHSFGVIYGTVSLAGALGTAIGPIVAGLIFDHFGNYDLAFSLCLIGSLLSACLIFCSKQPTSNSGIRE